jgi:PIN domain nuclease of toxin-antitoxin system
VDARLSGATPRAAQAQLEKLAVVTVDPQFERYDVALHRA